MEANLQIKENNIRKRIILLVLLIIVLLIMFIIYNMSKKTQYVAQLKEYMIGNTKGTTYYVSANGTSEEGTEENNPMSLKTANTKKYKGNDRILLKSGETFYGIINFDIQTTENKYVYIGAYGEGAKPVISGANILINSHAWIKENELYKIDLSNYDNFEGIREKSWEPYNIGFLADEKGNIYGARKKEKEQIKQEFDYYCEDNYLYIKCSKNPTEKLGKIKFVPRNNLVSLSSNTILENIDIQYTGAHGIVKKNDEIQNVWIKNCIMQNIGGSVQIEDTFVRYGNGLEFWNSATNTIVERCIFRDIYDAGYTMQGNSALTGFENNICKNNIFINCTYTYETFCKNYNNPLLDKQLYLKGQKFIDNISINQGRGWGYEVRPDKEPAAEFVLWSMPIANTDIEMSGNKLYNSRMLRYKSKNYDISIEDYKKAINSDNNYIYMSNDTCFINGNKSVDILKEYGMEPNSKFYILNTQDLHDINNLNIIKSNDYNKISKYYNEIENDFIN